MISNDYTVVGMLIWEYNESNNSVLRGLRMKNYHKKFIQNNKILDHISDPVFCVDNSRNVIYMNTAFEKCFDIKLLNHKAIKIDEYLSNKNQKTFEKTISEMKTTQVKRQKIVFEVNSTKKEFIGNFDLVDSSSSKDSYICIVLTDDKGKLKRTEETLRSVNKPLASIIEAANLGTWEWQPENGSLVINDRWAEIIGYTKDALEPMSFDTWINHTHPEDLKDAKAQLKLISNSILEFYNFEIRMIHKKGHLIWVKTKGKVIEWTEDQEAKLIVGTHEDISERKELQKDLEEKEKENRLLITEMAHGLAVHEIICDENDKPSDYRFLSMNKKFEEQTGLKQEDIIGKRVMEVLPATEQYWIDIYGSVALTGEAIHFENYSKETKRWFKVSAYSPKPKQFAVLVDDITDRKRIENELFLEKEFFRTTLLSVGDGVISTDALGNIVVMNKVALDLTGWHLKEVLGKKINEVFKIKDEITNELIDNSMDQFLGLNKFFQESNTNVLLSRFGDTFPIEETASLIKDKSGNVTGVVIVFKDISERRKKEKQIEYLSFHDALTGMYNQRFIDETIKRLDVQRNLPLSMMILDVNGLKLTNDAFGHAAGDELLIQISEILNHVCRDDEIIGRIGGDEFLIILPKVPREGTKNIKERILKEIESFKESKVVVSLAIGSATKTSLEMKIADVKVEADRRMYKDKLKNGKIMRNKTIDKIMSRINHEIKFEKEHTAEVSEYCGLIGSFLDFRVSEIEEIKMAGLLHDIGKISIPLEILTKGDLSDGDFDLIKRHPEISYQILKSVDRYVKIATTVLHHHERWDGSGYPEGLKGEEIPLKSRIIAVADAYQAMTSERIHRDKKSKAEAIRELKKCSGKQFDPGIVDIFINKILI